MTSHLITTLTSSLPSPHHYPHLITTIPHHYPHLITTHTSSLPSPHHYPHLITTLTSSLPSPHHYPHLITTLTLPILPTFSYNSVVPTQELGSLLPEPAPSPSKPWRVSSRWLTDMDAFNEWMNEEDYEMVPVSPSAI